MLLVTSSCKKKQLIRPGDPLPEAFDKAMNVYEQEKYADAANAFETVINAGRGTDYGRRAQFYLAESYFNDRRFLLAASEYERYVSLYPRSERRVEAQFKEALSYFRTSPRYRLDQKYTRRAIEKFRLFQSQHPDSDYNQQSADYINQLREKLAHKLYNAAASYMRWEMYEAATIYYGLTIDRYPESQWAERALVDQINAFVVYANKSVRDKQRGRYEKAIESYEKYLQLFPNGEHRELAEKYVDDARVAINSLPSGGESESGAATNR